MAEHNDLGRLGEKIARTYMEAKGYRILDQNWVYGRAEMDLIAWYKKKIIFIEVKTRRSTEHGAPEDFVNWKKEKQMELASSVYIENKKHEGEIRFDIVAIVFQNIDLYEINHIEDAFWPS